MGFAFNSCKPSRLASNALCQHSFNPIFCIMSWCCAELYAIIQATERLEKLYVKDAVASEQYEKACERLIQQFKVLWGSLGSLVSGMNV